MYHERRRFSLKVLLVDEQLDHALALPLFALSLTVYAWAVSKLDARTVNLSLPPSAMERDKPDIATLGSARTVTVWLAESRLILNVPIFRYSVAVTSALPALHP